MPLFSHLKAFFTENQMSVVFLALIVGLLFPEQLNFLGNYSTHLLITVFFTSSLRLDSKELFGYAKDWRMLLITNVFMLVILPFALYYPSLAFSQEWALALLILGAMPTGMTIALVADFFGGKTSLALVITATTSLLAPLTIPLIFKIAVDRIVPIPVLDMFWSLVLTIVIPFALAMLVKKAIPKKVSKYDHLIRTISVACFGILIAGIVAGSSGDTLISLSLRDLFIVIVSMIWLGVLIWVSYYLVRWRPPADRVTIALCMVYLNNTLALFIGSKFFKEYQVVPKLLLLLLVVNALLPPLKWAASHVTHIHDGERNRNPIT